MRLNQYKRPLFFSTLALLISVTYNACGKGFVASRLSSSSGEQVCRVPKAGAAEQASAPVFISPFAADKLQVDAMAPQAAIEGWVITVDKSCLRGSDYRLKAAALQIDDLDPALAGQEFGLATVKVSLNSALSMGQIRAALQQENCVMGLSQNVRASAFVVPSDPRYGELKHLKVVGMDDAYDVMQSNWALSGANSVTIAIIDDGMNLTHPDLRDNLWFNTAEMNGATGVDDDNNGYIDDVNGYDFADRVANPNHKSGPFHGSHVAGLAAARIGNNVGVVGVMTGNVKLMALNVFGSDSNSTSSTSIDEAIRYAADNGADVINMSLGGRARSPSTLTAMQYAVSKGVVVIAAAGNAGEEVTEAQFTFPAGYAKDIQGMLSVGAVDAASVNTLCSFSNYSTTYVEIAAPGCDTQAPQNNGLLSTLSTDTYGYFAGTSMASPMIAGAAAAALLAIKNRTSSRVTPAQIESLLVSGSGAESTLLNQIKGGKNLNHTSLFVALQSQYPLAPTGTCN